MGKCGELSIVCVKTLSVVVNLTFLLLGCGVIGAGIWIHVNRDSLMFMFALHGSLTEVLHYLLLSVGSVLVAIGFMGCFGACTESVCFLGFCSFLCVLIIICEIIFGCLVSFLSKELLQVLFAEMWYKLRHQYNATALPVVENSSESNNVTIAWDVLQIKFNCCGVVGPSDYIYSSWFNHSKAADGLFVPTSCCLLHDSDDNDDDGFPDVDRDFGSCQAEAILYPRIKIHQRQHLKSRGCQPVIVEWISENRSPAISALCLLAVVQFVNLFSSCALLRSIRKKMSDYSWSDDDEELEME